MSDNIHDLAINNRKNLTDSERKLWYVLRRDFLGVHFRRQHKIGNYIVDFVSVKNKIIIECDGGQHTEEKDRIRSKYLESLGYKIIRFWNNEILSNIDGCIYMIQKELNNTPS